MNFKNLNFHVLNFGSAKHANTQLAALEALQRLQGPEQKPAESEDFGWDTKPLFSRTDFFKIKERDMDTGISWLENVIGILIKAF